MPDQPSPRSIVAPPTTDGLGSSEKGYFQLGFLALTLPLAGCDARGAPALIIAGAYFPGWMVCALTGIIATILTRVVIVAFGLSQKIPFQLGVCLAVGLVIAVLTSRLWFGR